MADSIKKRISRAIDKASSQARELAKSIQPRPKLTPIPVPARPRR